MSAGRTKWVWLAWAMISSLAGASELNGAGSFIPAPLYAAWGESYRIRNPGTIIKYQGISPAEGINRITNKTVDFAGVDMPLNLAELNQRGLVQFPIALGAVAPIVNLPGVYAGELRLDGKTLGDIFLGKITKWNDPALRAMNPHIELPDANIVVLHRATKGVRTILGNYLIKVHPEWQARMGEGMTGAWPAGSREVKDPVEMNDRIQQTPNAIGYMEVGQIMRNKLVYVQLKNHDGKFVSPGDENISAAAESVNWSLDNGFDEVLTDRPGATSWPVCMTTIAVMRKVSEQPDRSRELLDFFSHGYRLGQLSAVQSGYVPLPNSVFAIIRNSWKTSIVDSNGQPVWKR
ncbi:MAG TPA: phosphate ABC transporter substrate-binding protein PstS [Gallionellaceae bacterium]